MLGNNLPDTIEIEVTQEVLNESCQRIQSGRRISTNCPTAVALNKLGYTNPSVGLSDIILSGDVSQYRASAELEAEIENFNWTYHRTFRLGKYIITKIKESK